MQKAAAFLSALAVLPLAASAATSAASTERVFTIRYTATVGPLPAGQGPVDVFVPLPEKSDGQDVLSLEVKSGLAGAQETETRFGNTFWHGHAKVSDGKPIEVTVLATVRRRALHGPIDQAGPQSYSADEDSKFAKFLGPDRLVPLKGAPIEAIDNEIIEKLGPEKAKDQALVARAIYDYVVDHMEYKKVGTGWGNGDTFWACSAKYGNCTDFHALFLSLARRHGIPSKFEMGFPIPSDKPAGKVSGYHCWVEFYLPGRGWVPVDASEAQKHPEQRALLFGGQPPDRVQLSIGRDLVLPGMKGEPLNYFVYPYVELAGAATKTVTWTLDYADSAPPAAVQ